MTNLKLIDIYLEGFRACHYDKLSNSDCPYSLESVQANYWQTGYQYAENLDKILTVVVYTDLQQQMITLPN